MKQTSKKLPIPKSPKIDFRKESSNRKTILDLAKLSPTPAKAMLMSKTFVENMKKKKDSKKMANNLGQTVKIKVDPDDWEPISVADFVLNAAKEWKYREALAYSSPEGWSFIKYITYFNEVMKAAKAFIAMGLKQQESVAIMCFSSPSSFIYTLAAIFAGGIFVNIPNVENRQTLVQILDECKVNIIVVDSYRQVNMAQDLFETVLSLKAIIMADPMAATTNSYPKILSNLMISIKRGNNQVFHRSDVLALAADTPDTALIDRLDNISPERCCAVFYPVQQLSVINAAPPIGVMYNHDNLTYMARILGQKLIDEQCHQDHHEDTRRSDTFEQDFRIVSYLPFTTPFAFILEVLVPMTAGGLVCFAKEDALQGTLVHTLREVQPTIFCGTKKVWCLLQKRLAQRVKKVGILQKKLLVFTKRKALYDFYKNQIKYKHKFLAVRQPHSFVKYVTAKVKRTFGLNKCGLFLCYGGHLRIETLEYFLGFDIPIFETLTSPYLAGPHSMASHGDYLLGSVGWELPSLTSRLIPLSKFAMLYVQGRHVCMGIISPNSLDVLYEQDLIYTGVTVYRSVLGFLHIPNPSKDVMVLLNGTEVKYMAVEKAFKDTMPIVSRCMLIGHGRIFPIILLTLKTEVDSMGAATTVLSKSVKRWLKQRKIICNNVEALVNIKAVYEIIEDAVISVNKRMKHRGCRIKRWRVLPYDFSVVDGELDPLTLSLRREKVQAKYRTVIESMYSSIEDKYLLR